MLDVITKTKQPIFFGFEITIFEGMESGRHGFMFEIKKGERTMTGNIVECFDDALDAAIIIIRDVAFFGNS